ncbi:hypothetical protein CC86DRAFT_372568 [Ophiobolus disseminans]|uniref:Uncharacterized protein n=1 Tax=Ophiobolus disseminans TaxID=1469910 RepID=A0A6A6ZR58_9PLEO|nr:hypothetical protein CC86DRAFT_372568 [Ophiobolus disseminans]
MLRERKRKQLPCGAPFEVGFKLVREFKKIEEHWYTPNYRFWIDVAGEVVVEKRCSMRSIAWKE